MTLFSPAMSGRGRLVVALAASILVHGFALGYWWENTWLLPTTKWPVEIDRGDHLTVFLDFHRVSEVSFVKEGEVRASNIIEQPEATQKPSVSEPRGERGAVPAPEDFITIERLSVSAQPLTDIQIPWPPGLPVMGVTSAVFTIFIDELGIVRDVVPDGHTLSPVMEAVARDAFLAAAFRPALLNGRAVKSIKRIEVEFEFLPIQQLEDVPGVVSKKELL